MIDLRLAYNDSSLSRIRKNPRQWKLFLFLLAHADEKGYVEMSLRQIAEEVKMPFSTVQSMMTSVSFRSILGHISVSHQTLISIYHIERYVVPENPTSVKLRSNFGQTSVTSGENTADTERKKGSPHTPFKEEKENATTEVATLQKKEKEAAGAEFSLSVERAPLEERRQRFWADCCHCHARHPEWPAEAVKSFFLYWTQLTQDGRRFKFETEAVWGIGHRMASYIQQGHWLTEVASAKLERIRSGGGGGRGRGAASTSELERRRAQAVNDEAMAAYDRYFAEKSTS